MVTTRSLVLLLGGALLGCAGGAPLLHPAHVLRPGTVATGAGVSGEMVIAGGLGVEGASGERPAMPGALGRDPLERLTVAPGVAPWVSGRVGIDGENEAGLAYTGHAVRLDGRHAFSLEETTVSVGLGASAILGAGTAERAPGSALYGGGLDVPILVGFQSSSDLYALWLGPRFGFDLVGGEVALPAADGRAGRTVDASGSHLQLGFVVGVRAGFRHVHAAIEVGGAYHLVTAELGGEKATIEQATIAPGGGLIATF